MPYALLSNAVVADLKQLNSNCVINSGALTDGQNTYNSIRGYVGLETPEGDELTIALNWDHSANLNGLLLKVSYVGPQKISIQTLEQPKGLSQAQIDNLVASFLGHMRPKLATKIKKQNAAKKSQGGSYTGRRLEAHPRHRKAPKDRFDESTHLFTQKFAETARLLNITYK